MTRLATPTFTFLFWRAGAAIALGLSPQATERWIEELRATYEMAPGPFLNDGPPLHVAVPLARATQQGLTPRVLGELAAAIVDAHIDPDDLASGWERARVLLQPIMEQYGGELPKLCRLGCRAQQ
ncbi:hypothetical protein YTPLAS18_40560 [Nitrospira sp.]|nr:hypothetical protein YTPLAS18_40560 [Nitrospira sp.]